MKRTTCTPLLLVALLALSAQISNAQSPPPVRSGMGFSLGLGNGSAGVKCDGCPFQVEDRMDGLTGYVRVGGYANPKFFAGVEGTGWMKNSDGLQRRIAAISVVFVGYASPTNGFFLRSGVGMIRAVIEDDQDNYAQGDGITWQIGAGYDIPFGPGVALTPFVTYVQSMETVLHINGFSTGINLNPNILQVGLAITLR